MAFLTGPRQVGKTTLARTETGSYHNWDTAETKRAFLRDPYFFRSNERIVVFDEIHKRRDWKKLLKGYYDSPGRRENFIVTGSGRFDLYRRSGDSLQGRALVSQLWPLTYDEVASTPYAGKPRDFSQWEPPSVAEDDAPLVSLGGFPQPFARQSASFLRRWQDQYVERLVREDTRDFAAIQRLDALELLARLLPTRLCSPLSHKSLAEDLDVSPVAVKSWLRLLEQLYFGFSCKPFHRNIARAVKREQKWYFHQWTFAQDEGARHENYLATQISAALSAWSEWGAGTWELCYLRDQDRREVDFLILRDLKPVALVEAKLSDAEPTSALRFYAKKLKLPAFQITRSSGPRRHGDGVWSMGARYFLRGLHAGQ